MRVVLRTGDGGLVTRADIPEFNAFPDVVTWGTRIFVHAGGGHYREAFAYAVLPGQEVG